MNVYIKFITSKTLTFNVEPTETLAQLLQRVHEREGLEPARMKLVYGGKLLGPDLQKTLADYSVPNDATIHALVQVLGDV
jgi:hypothetical protein